MLKMQDSELRLVAACCRPMRQPERSGAISALASDAFDADRLLAIARAHRVEALVEEGLAQAGVVLPQTAADLLTRRVRIARLQMLRNAGEEIRLAGLLRDAGIDAIFVKGATLAMLAYRTLSYKASWDIDLLVGKKSIDQAISVLGSAGYSFDHPEIPGAELARHFAKEFRESSWTNAERGITVELHWALASNPRFLAGVGVGSAHQTVAIAEDQTVATLATPDLFAFLAVHGMAHGWSRLKWLADIAALVNDTPDALPELFDHAQRINAGRCAAVALSLMHRLLGVSLPDQLNALAASDRQVAALADYSIRAMQSLVTSDGKIDQSLSSWWEMHVAQMRMAPGFRNGFADIWAKLNQPVPLRRLRLPRWLLVPDALIIWIPYGILRRIAGRLQQLWAGIAARK